MDRQTLEKYSSAFTLSDMEVFLFPELMYALVLANIMSPRLWKWREDPWFKDIKKLNFNRQMQRLKQYVMEHYSFNLDIETWGVTTKQRELERFSTFVAPEIFSRSNALFGYEGDKYYFDINIRQHFGMDRFTTDVIPYWKTETVEAMDAFRFKDGYATGAGECVSLAALYAAALYIVLEVPLEKIYMMATPLHSQNYVAVGEGVITNNRRIVTKNMWFNGTVLSTKARRAMEKERVTIVAHCSGYAHIDYPEATINREAYHGFLEMLNKYLVTEVNFEIFANFLRVYNQYQKYFQFEFFSGGHHCFLNAERLYQYEHGSNYRVGDVSRKKLLLEVESEEFDLRPDPKRHPLHIVEKKLNGKPLRCGLEDVDRKLKTVLHLIPEIDDFCKDIKQFTCAAPRIPLEDKRFVNSQPVGLKAGMTRESIIAYLETLRESSTTVDLAFYAGRRIDEKGWQPYLAACLERNPVCLDVFKKLEIPLIYEQLCQWPDTSIYDEQGFATPDEVVNFQRGDGLEKALCLVNCGRARKQSVQIIFNASINSLQVSVGKDMFEFFASRRPAFWETTPCLLKLDVVDKNTVV